MAGAVEVRRVRPPAARSSIRKRKKSAEPPNPPSSHVGQLRGLLFFAYDCADRFRGRRAGAVLRRAAQSPGAPELLERSGVVTRRTKKGEARVYHYRGNPYMAPALEAEAPKFVSQFKDML